VTPTLAVWSERYRPGGGLRRGIAKPGTKPGNRRDAPDPRTSGRRASGTPWPRPAGRPGARPRAAGRGGAARGERPDRRRHRRARRRRPACRRTRGLAREQGYGGAEPARRLAAAAAEGGARTPGMAGRAASARSRRACGPASRCAPSIRVSRTVPWPEGPGRCPAPVIAGRAARRRAGA